MRIIISLIIVLSLIVSQAGAQEPQARIKETQPVAQKAMETFGQLVSKENYRQMGFESPDEVQSATLGKPIKDFMVRLDELKKYEPGSKADVLLTETNIIIYPVLVKDKVRSSIIISKTDGSWQAVSFGGPAYIQSVSSTVLASSKATGLDYSSYFIVRIPSLNLFFIGFRSENVLMLVPLMDDARLKFKAGVSMKAEQVFSTVLPEAKAHDGMPR